MPQPIWQGDSTPPPYGKIPVEHGFSLRGSSLSPKVKIAVYRIFSFSAKKIVPQSARICAIGGQIAIWAMPKYTRFFLGWGFPNIIHIIMICQRNYKENSNLVEVSQSACMQIVTFKTRQNI